MMSTPFDADSFLEKATSQPGVYQMYDVEEQLIYVGKAKNLKNRLRSYFKSKTIAAKTQSLVSKIARIELTVTETENEALLLECNLIKQHRPRYNILLRDDKSYPYIFISAGEFPRVDIHRGAKKAKGHYYGPYPNGYAVRETIHLLQKLFKIRQCRDAFFRARTRPCLQYQIKRCTAPCVGLIEKQAYLRAIEHAKLFLEGKSYQVTDELAEKMERASAKQEYELAAHYRDLIIKLKDVQQQQYITQEGGNVDALAIAETAEHYCVQLLFVRGGRVLGSKSFYPKVPQAQTAKQVLNAFVCQYYLQNQQQQEQSASEIILSVEIEDQSLVSKVLTKLRQSQIKVTHSVRGRRKKWLQMAMKNAELAIAHHVNEKSNMAKRFADLQQRLQSDSLPRRIECFDVSHSQGEAAVASCVVFNEEGPLKSDYRRFNIEGIQAGDDYAAMKQALTRRYKRLKEGEGTLPDVLIIDGGKGQIHQAEKVFEELQITGVMLVSVVKGDGRQARNDRILTNHHGTELPLPHDSLAMHLLQQCRDEAHRFAISGHRKARDKKRKQSILEDIDGIGATRRQALLKRFGGLQEIGKASVDELAKVSGISKALAQKIYDRLH